MSVSFKKYSVDSICLQVSRLSDGSRNHLISFASLSTYYVQGTALETEVDAKNRKYLLW